MFVGAEEGEIKKPSRRGLFISYWIIS